MKPIRFKLMTYGLLLSVFVLCYFAFTPPGDIKMTNDPPIQEYNAAFSVPEIPAGPKITHIKSVGEKTCDVVARKLAEVEKKNAKAGKKVFGTYQHCASNVLTRALFTGAWIASHPQVPIIEISYIDPCDCYQRSCQFCVIIEYVG